MNRKAIALAAALVLLALLGVVGTPEEEILEYSAQVVYELTDIDGVPIQPNLQSPEIPIGQEQIVEGHTVFHTMNMVRPPPPPPKELNIIGLIECRYEILGVRLDLSHIDRIYAECNVGGRIWVSESNRMSPASADMISPTGWERIAYTPDSHVPVLVTEFEYFADVTDELGVTRQTRSYAWETQLLPTGTNPQSGKFYNFVGAVNLDRLRAMGSDHLTVWVGDLAADAVRAPAREAYPDHATEDLEATRGVQASASDEPVYWDENAGTWG